MSSTKIPVNKEGSSKMRKESKAERRFQKVKFSHCWWLLKNKGESKKWMNGFKRRAEKWMRQKKKSGVGYRIEWKGEAGRWSRSHRAEDGGNDLHKSRCVLSLPCSSGSHWGGTHVVLYLIVTPGSDKAAIPSLHTGHEAQGLQGTFSDHWIVLGYKATAPESKQLSLWRGKVTWKYPFPLFLFPSLFQLYLNLTAITNK